MTYELAEQITILAAPIYAALVGRLEVSTIEDADWQRMARAAALRQARLLWEEALAA